jgi:hypothetical protein
VASPWPLGNPLIAEHFLDQARVSSHSSSDTEKVIGHQEEKSHASTEETNIFLHFKKHWFLAHFLSTKTQAELEQLILISNLVTLDEALFFSLGISILLKIIKGKNQVSSKE